jgi:eukaryotic-like serine/threonine-protein kinase
LLADRRAAEWALSLGGTVRVRPWYTEKEIRAGGKLPTSNFELTGIDVSSKTVRDSDLAHLEGLAYLKVLNLEKTQVDDAGLAHLKGLASLLELKLGATQVSDAGLAHVAGLKNLKWLQLSSCGIRDDGLPALHGLPDLWELDLSKTQVTATGAAALQKVLPKCHVTALEPARVDPKLRRAYQSRNGEWKIEGDELVQASLFSDCELVYGDVTWKDYDFTCTVTKTGGVAAIGLLYHVTGAGYGKFMLGEDMNKVDLVGSIEHGSWAELKRRKGQLEKGRWYKLRVSVRGGHCQCWLDDQLVFEHDDPKNPQGAVGLRADVTAVRFRDLRVTDPSGRVLFEGLPELPVTADQWPPPTDRKSDSELHCLKGHGAPVRNVVFSRDGRHIVSSSNGGTGNFDDQDHGWATQHPASSLRLWSAETGEPLDCAPMAEPAWTSPVFLRLALAPDGRSVLAAVPNPVQGVQHWEIVGGKLRSQGFFKEEQPGEINALTCTSDGRGVLALAASGSIWEWELNNHKLVRQVAGAQRDVSCTAIAPDGRTAVLVRGGQPFTEIDLSTGQETRRWKPPTKAMVSLAFSPDGRQLLSGADRGGVRLWDVAAGEIRHTFDGHRGAAWVVAFSPDGRRALSGGQDHTVRLWDLEAKKELACFTGHTGPVQALAFSPDGARAGSGSEDYTVRVWRLPP